jgi:hypothetical protein
MKSTRNYTIGVTIKIDRELVISDNVMYEPWYENTLMSVDEARTHIFNALKNSCIDHLQLNQHIHKIIPDDYDMCSIRGYWTFQHNPFKNAVEDRYYYCKVHNNLKLAAFKAIKEFKKEL